MEKLLEHFMQEILEYRGDIDQDIRHNRIFKVACRGHKGRFPLVPLAYPHEVICTAEVQLNEDPSISEQLQSRWVERKGMSELHCDFVESMVNYAWPQASILLPPKKETGSSRGGRWLNVACCKASKMYSVASCSRMVTLVHFASGYWSPGRRSIVQSHG